MKRNKNLQQYKGLVRSYCVRWSIVNNLVCSYLESAFVQESQFALIRLRVFMRLAEVAQMIQQICDKDQLSFLLMSHTLS